ncbi:insulin-like growth factor 1 receptor [Phalacrocorax aristotelis]|uniref:insulin-like growth factor 1 receptor n=1 Tax=Phalacrocorax aristotelis TaxID=126867 RepID=UPI003F4B85D4
MDDVKLLTCLEQVASAMAYLHSRRIIHCSLQCSYIYINSGHSCPEVMAKVGRWGRAVCLPHPGTDDNLFEPYVRKVMPADAAKWAAPELRTDGLYSRASDVFSFGITTWEALMAPLTKLHMYKPLKPFSSLNSKEVLKFTELGSFPGDLGFPNLTRLIACMKACWNHNPTRRPAFPAILEMIRQEIQAVRDLEYARLAAVPSCIDMQDYDPVYFGSKAPEEDSFSHIYNMVLELEPNLPRAAGNVLDPADPPQVQLLEGNGLYFSKQDKWGDMVGEFEAKRGIDRSPTTLKETGWYGDTGINWHYQ